MGNLSEKGEFNLSTALPRNATSKAGYEFDPSSDRWKLDKEVSIPFTHAQNLTPEANLGFRQTLMRYAEDYSSRHVANMAGAFYRYLRDTNASEVTSIDLINWRAGLETRREWRLGSLKGFLLSWHGWEFPGIDENIAALLDGWRISGNEKGVNVVRGDPERGPYSDLELHAIFDWANRAMSNAAIGLEAFAYMMTLIMTARRPVQIAALRGIDLVKKAEGPDSLCIRFPRSKQRGSGFRQEFREISVLEDLFMAVQALHKRSVDRVETQIGSSIPAELAQQVPIFINVEALSGITDVHGLIEALMGAAPDLLHAPTRHLELHMRKCEKECDAKSERNGKRIHLFATRFRYTRGTKLRREGFGEEIIAELLDHSDVQNVKVYTENTVQEAEIIDRLIGPRLAPFAQACAGTLVKSEREAVRGNDPRSRVPNHKQDAVGTCGNYGFCASGYLACYTCHFFQPWIDAPHGDVLEKLYAEKQRSADVGCAPEIINATDRQILAVEHCIALCDEARRSQASLSDAPRDHRG